MENQDKELHTKFLYIVYIFNYVYYLVLDFNKSEVAHRMYGFNLVLRINTKMFRKHTCKINICDSDKLDIIRASEDIRI